MTKNTLPILREVSILGLVFIAGLIAGRISPLPSALVSMALFLVLLIVKVLKVEHFSHITPLLLSHLALFFIPPTVMILDSYELFAGDAWKIILLLVVSNILVMGVTGMVVQYFLKEGSHE